jgi:hypothetical protein
VKHLKITRGWRPLPNGVWVEIRDGIADFNRILIRNAVTTGNQTSTSGQNIQEVEQSESEAQGASGTGPYEQAEAASRAAINPQPSTSWQ